MIARLAVAAALLAFCRVSAAPERGFVSKAPAAKWEHALVSGNGIHGARGIHVPSRASTHGFNNHFDATWPMTFWTAGAAWAGQFRMVARCGQGGAAFQ